MPHFPEWILNEARRNKAGFRCGAASKTAGDLSRHKLHTVCDEALCPNKGKCFSEGEATFLILGDICTRSCAFCAVKKRTPAPPDPDEPRRIGLLAGEWRLKYVVFTSPTRDDLPDGGAAHFAKTAVEIKRSCAGARVEPLVPDFNGDAKSLETVLNSDPDVLGHNIETVPSLYDKVRAGADYRRSLTLIKNSKDIRPDILTKSGLMLGLGETEKEIEAALNDLLEHKCDLLTLGQYLAPSRNHLPVKRYPAPEEFAAWGEKAEKMGFKAALSGPMVRSSYKASQLYGKARARSGAQAGLR